MRVVVLMSALATMSLAGPLAAQQPTSVQQEIRLTRDEIRRDRQAIVKMTEKARPVVAVIWR